MTSCSLILKMEKVSRGEANALPLVTCLFSEGVGFQAFLRFPYSHPLEIILGDKHYSFSFSQEKLEADVVDSQTRGALEHEGIL